MCDPCGARHCLCSCWLVKSGKTSARLGQLRSAYIIRKPSLTGAKLVQTVDIWSGHFDLGYFIFGFGSLQLLATRRLKTVSYFCYLKIYERFRHFFGFIEIAQIWWVSVKKVQETFFVYY